MKKLIFALAAAVTMVAGAAQAERYVMVTHGEGKDPFWPVVQKGGEDAARHVGADFEYIFNPSGDMGDMAKSITAAAAKQLDIAESQATDLEKVSNRRDLNRS